MSDQKAVPKGLCNQEIKKGLTKKPPNTYNLVEDIILGKQVKGDEYLFKFKINNKTTVNASVWTRGLSHQQGLH